jgi:hypothetical protein
MWMLPTTATSGFDPLVFRDAADAPPPLPLPQADASARTPRSVRRNDEKRRIEDVTPQRRGALR